MRFIELKEIEPIYYDRAYYLEPDEGGERAYALLQETMKDTGKVDLAKITLKNREHIATLRVFHDVLVLQILLYARNIVRPETFNIPRKVSLNEKELALATKLIRYFLYNFL